MELEYKLICICDHPKNWHESNEVTKFDICMGKFCQCVRFRQSLFLYDSAKWADKNGLQMVKNRKAKTKLTVYK